MAYIVENSESEEDATDAAGRPDRVGKRRRTTLDGLCSCFETALSPESPPQRFDRDGVLSVFQQIGGGRDVIVGDAFELLAASLGWPSRPCQDFLVLLFFVHRHTPATVGSCFEFHCEPFIAAFEDFGVSSIPEFVKAAARTLRQCYFHGDFLSLDYHRFVFTYLLLWSRRSLSLEEVKYARTIPVAVAKHALIACAAQLSLYTMPFCAFLDQTNVLYLNMDQWMEFHHFTRVVAYPTLAFYNESDCWPCLLDDFVAWFKQTRNIASACFDETPMELER